MHETTILLIEVGALLFALGMLGRLGRRIGLSPIPLYLLAGLALLLIIARLAVLALLLTGLAALCQLLQLRAQILRRKDSLADSAKEEQPAFSLHMADAGTDEFDRDFALSLMSSEQNALYEVDQALTRIRNGTYGVCEITGEAIEAERLAAIPWARFSAAAQRELELSGSVRRTQLAQRGSLTQSEASDRYDSDDETPAAGS